MIRVARRARQTWSAALSMGRSSALPLSTSSNSATMTPPAPLMCRATASALGVQAEPGYTLLRGDAEVGDAEPGRAGARPPSVDIGPYDFGFSAMY
jgi:hypothetical protein